MIDITEGAVEKIQSLIAAENDPNIMGFRVSIKGGGCSGFQYVFDFVLDGEEEEGDTVFEQHGLQVYVDPLSFQYVAGATIELVSSIAGEYITVKNPNATAQCGCGNSFSA